MMALTALLSTLMGMTLGMLGGGGSILAVPILLYVAGTEPREAIATSLLVVAITSVLCVVQHSRAGFVRWRTGLTFGSFAMLGAFGGGLLAQFVAADILLVLFSAMMVFAGLAMLRGRRGRNESPSLESELPLGKAAAEGLIVGAATGLVGAGGGFLVVPALVLLGGLDMRAAVGTSSLVIAMKSFAGFAGHASHVPIDWALAGWIVGFAIVGSLVGTAVVRKLDPSKLRRAFGAFTLVMASVLAYNEAPAELIQALFVDRWPFWAGGAAIGAFVLVFLASTGRALGVSTGYADACSVPFDPEARRSWRLPFLAGILGGGFLAALASGQLEPTHAMGMFDTLVGSSVALKAVVFTFGGVLLGFGARLAGGCTSGHGIVGVAQLARSSLIATAVFMATGILFTNFIVHTLGG